jgi:cation diffusion facilitator CzcD-associated flavoprotein CzcO
MGRTQNLLRYAVTHPILFLYQVLQYVLDFVLSPTPPPPQAKLVRPKIAVIGAGLTGVSAASHIVGHGFDCRIFEAGPRENVGGIWSKVNNTSGLQIHSIMYRFHPSVHWKKGYPDRQQIVSQITSLWKKYGLDSKTEFNTRVERVYKDSDGRWIINDPSHGRFDGVVAAIGTCGDPKMYANPQDYMRQIQEC